MALPWVFCEEKAITGSWYFCLAKGVPVGRALSRLCHSGPTEVGRTGARHPAHLPSFLLFVPDTPPTTEHKGLSTSRCLHIALVPRYSQTRSTQEVFDTLLEPAPHLIVQAAAIMNKSLGGVDTRATVCTVSAGRPSAPTPYYHASPVPLRGHSPGLCLGPGHLGVAQAARPLSSPTGQPPPAAGDCSAPGTDPRPGPPGTAAGGPRRGRRRRRRPGQPPLQRQLQGCAAAEPAAAGRRRAAGQHAAGGAADLGDRGGAGRGAAAEPADAAAAAGLAGAGGAAGGGAGEAGRPHLVCPRTCRARGGSDAGRGPLAHRCPSRSTRLQSETCACPPRLQTKCKNDAAYMNVLKDMLHET